MAKYDRADLLARCQLLSGRPANDQSMTPARWYLLMTEAQDYVFNLIAGFCPEAMYGAPVLLQSDDGGYTYRLPLDPAGDQVFPVGLAEVRARRAGQLLTLGPEWQDGVDLTPEGNLLRVPGGRSHVFSGGPYIRYAASPGVVNDTTDVTLVPKLARILIAYHALYLWASRPPNPADPQYYLTMFQKAWCGDPLMPGDNGIMGVLASQYLGQDGGEDAGDGVWWHSSDFG